MSDCETLYQASEDRLRSARSYFRLGNATESVNREAVTFPRTLVGHE